MFKFNFDLDDLDIGNLNVDDENQPADVVNEKPVTESLIELQTFTEIPISQLVRPTISHDWPRYFTGKCIARSTSIFDIFLASFSAAVVRTSTNTCSEGLV